MIQAPCGPPRALPATRRHRRGRAAAGRRVERDAGHRGLHKLPFAICRGSKILRAVRQSLFTLVSSGEAPAGFSCPGAQRSCLRIRVLRPLRPYFGQNTGSGQARPAGSQWVIRQMCRSRPNVCRRCGGAYPRNIKFCCRCGQTFFKFAAYIFTPKMRIIASIVCNPIKS